MPNKTMVILQNKANSGKTSTLRELANILTHKNTYTALEGNLSKGDFIIKTSYKSKTIIIISMGDIDTLLEKKYKKVWDEYSNIDIIFGACRTKGGTIAVVKEQAKDKGFDVIWTSTYKNKAYQANLNKKRANELFNGFC